MIELKVEEIIRHIKLNNILDDVDEKDEYSKDMDILVCYLNSTFLHKSSFKIKNTIYFGEDIDNITFKVLSGGDHVTVDDSVHKYLAEHFLLSYDSIVEISKHWVYKRIGVKATNFRFENNLSKSVFIKLNG